MAGLNSNNFHRTQYTCFDTALKPVPGSSAKLIIQCSTL